MAAIALHPVVFDQNSPYGLEEKHLLEQIPYGQQISDIAHHVKQGIKNTLAPGPANSKQAASAGQLTPEEMRAFKAIGRTVRRLARKKRLAATAAHEAPASQPPQRTLPGLDAQGAAAMMFSAFDLVLFLDHDFAVTRTEGRPQQIGWRKASLLGKPAADVLPPAEQAIFRRMVKKLEAGAKVCRDTLLLSGEAGGNVPCRAVFSCWPDGNAHYFLALLSLSVPARLKRSPGLPQITRLAA